MFTAKVQRQRPPRSVTDHADKQGDPSGNIRDTLADASPTTPYIQKDPIVDQENWYQMQLDSDPASVAIPGKQAAMAGASLKSQGEETYPLNSEAAARLLQLQKEWTKRKEEEEVDELELREEELALGEAKAELALKRKRSC